MSEYEREETLAAEMTVRCRRCGWSTTGVARDALAAFRSHLCGSV